MLTRLSVSFVMCVLLSAAVVMPLGLAAQPGPASAAAGRDSAAVLRVQSLMEAGDLSQAQNMAESAMRQAPHDGNLENLLGVIAVSRGENTAAATWFGKAVQDAPGLVPASFNLARLYLEHPAEFPEAEDKAKELYQRALRHDPHSAEANAELALIEERHGEYGAALEHVDAIAAKDSHSLLLDALRCGAEGAMRKAPRTDAACSSLAANPQTTEDDALIAIPGLRAGARADLIVKLLESVQQHQALSPAGLRWLGLAQDATGNSAAARVTLERAFAGAPQNGGLLVDLASVAQRQGKQQDALGYLAHARELQPDDPEVHYRFARACIALGLLGEARNAMERALVLRPDDAEYNLVMGKVTALSQDPLAAKPFLEKYHALRPEDPEGFLLLGLIEYRVKEFELARPWLLKAADNTATSAEANLYLGSGERQLGDLASAQTYLERSAKQNGSDAEVHAELGLLALQQHHDAAAEQELDRAIALDPRSYSGNYGLLQLYGRTGDPRRAEQLKRFDMVKDQNEALNRQAMRVIEIHRNAGDGSPQP